MSDRTSAGSFDPAEAGWRRLDTANFIDLLGPLWHRTTDEGTQYAIVVTDKHKNRRGVAHGGVLTSLLDTALGLASRAHQGRPQATISLDVQFFAPVEIGDFLVVEARLAKSTRSIMFMQGEARVGDRVCASAQGIWKILRE